MKTPVYESSPGALQALLTSKRFVRADLYTITLANSAGVLRYTTCDVDVVVPALGTWSGREPQFDTFATKAKAHWKVGLNVDTWQVVVQPRSVGNPPVYPASLLGQPWLTAAQAGALDGAEIKVDRAYFTGWPQPWTPTVTPVGVYNVFTGLVGNVEVGEQAAVILANSPLVLLANNNMPRNTFGAGCRHTLFDAGCNADGTMLPASFSVTGCTVQSGSTDSALNATVPSAIPGSGTASLGQVVFTSGANSGFRRGVRLYTPGSPAVFQLVSPLPFDVAPGDTFTAIAGCDKRPITCGLFSNFVNYGGVDYIPAPENAI